MSADEIIRVRWCGEVHSARVLRWYKNGKARVEIGRAIWTGGRMGSLTDATTTTVEPWQIVADDD